MIIRKLTTGLALIALLFAPNIYAVGLSHIQVYSKLNQPLSAKINVLSVPKGKASALQVNLASASAFRRAGIERPYVLTKLRFSAIATGKTSAAIRISTQQPLKEPFINFLVEVSWPGGRILREYTALLDPPLYKPKLRTITAQSTRRTATNTSRRVSKKSTTSRRRTQNTRRTNVKRSSRPNRSSRRTRTKNRQPVRAPRPRGGGSYTVSRNDTLWRIANRTRPKGVSLNQHMLNIYRSNSSAFIRGNKNLIKSGKVLRIPGWKKGTKFTSRQAVRTVQRQQPRRTSQAPKTRKTTNAPKPEPTVEPRLLITSPDSLNRTTGAVSSPQISGAGAIKLEKQIRELQVENQKLGSENKALKSDVTETKKLVKNLKSKLDEVLALQNKQLGKLQEQLKKQTELKKTI
ncbi:conserved hypothetical protein, secreted [Beggiatoa sp. PS]|nr:conserved hypothetical protein, secreted [Beggiatoa sp. PS]